MKSGSGSSSGPADAGFLTAVFGASALALSVIALAAVQVARTDHLASRRNWERLSDRYHAEGLATLAAWRVLHTDQLVALAWKEPFGGGAADVVAEPEARKLGLANVSELRAQKRLAELLGPAAAERVIPKLAELAAQPEPPSREMLRAVDDSAGWRTCGLSAVSTYSRLTDDALVAALPVLSRTAVDRTGEVWRITVATQGRVLLDRLIRFTGDANQPVAVLDQLSSPANPVACVGGTHGESEAWP